MKLALGFEYDAHPVSESLMPLSLILFQTDNVRGSEMLTEYEELIRAVERLAVVQNFYSGVKRELFGPRSMNRDVQRR